MFIFSIGFIIVMELDNLSHLPLLKQDSLPSLLEYARISGFVPYEAAMVQTSLERRGLVIVIGRADISGVPHVVYGMDITPDNLVREINCFGVESMPSYTPYIRYDQTYVPNKTIHAPSDQYAQT
jgi:hypothetical protein